MSQPKSWNPLLGESPDAPIVLRKHRKRDDAEIDITPMIDIVFLLLIFFLVCTKIDEDASVDNPEAEHGVTVSQRMTTTITIDQQDNQTLVYLGEGTNGLLLPSDPAAQEETIVNAIESGLLEGKNAVLINAPKGDRCGDIARVTKIVGLVEGVQLHFKTKEPQ